MSFGYKRNKEAVSGGMEFGRGNYFKFPVGKTLIRILPPFNERGVWYKEVNEYFFDGLPLPSGKQLISPRGLNQEQDDPIYRMGGNLYKKGGPENVNNAKKLRSRQRIYVNAVILSSPKPEDVTGKIVTIPLPVKLAKELRDYDVDEANGWADITDIAKGRNFEITREGTKVDDTKYSLKPSQQTLDISAHLKAQGHDLFSQELPDLDKVYTASSTEELQRVVDLIHETGWLDGNAPQGEAPPTGPAPVNNAFTEFAAPRGDGHVQAAEPSAPALDIGEMIKAMAAANTGGGGNVMDFLSKLGVNPAPASPVESAEGTSE